MSQQRFLPEERFAIPRDGGELIYYRYGPVNNSDSNKNILAIHGISSTNRMWQNFSRTATKNGYTVYAVDLRGRGHSNTIKGSSWGIHTHALDMVAVLDHANLTICDVIGHSMGGFVVAELVRIAPNRINKATLLDGGLPFPVPSSVPFEEFLSKVLGPALARLARTFQDKEDYRAYWRAHPAILGRGWTDVIEEYSDYDLQGQIGSMHARTLSEAFTADSRELFQSEHAGTALKELDRDVLLIRATRGLMNEETPIYPANVIEKTLLEYPRVKMVTLEDVNHYDILLDQSCSDRCIKLVYPDMMV